jgi:hypothetical protein
MLEPGERIDAIFQARRGPNPHLALLAIAAFVALKFFVSTVVFIIILIPLAPLPAIVVMLTSHFVVIAITDRRLAVLRAAPHAPGVPKEVEATHPRDTRLELNHWPLWRAFHLGGERYWVARRFWRQLRAARLVPKAASA